MTPTPSPPAINAISDERLAEIEGTIHRRMVMGSRTLTWIDKNNLLAIIARLRAAEAVIECTPVIPWEYDSEAHEGAYRTWIASKGGGK